MLRETSVVISGQELATRGGLCDTFSAGSLHLLKPPCLDPAAYSTNAFAVTMAAAIASL
jgi:hypothetical protein